MNTLPKNARILEIGSGAGWQAKKLASHGFNVQGIDVKGNDINYSYDSERIWEVTVYDGHTIPFADKSFDVIYSSNVLEHIPHVEEFQKELIRVLKDDGVCVHILPSTAWRFWSSITYYAVRILNYIPLIKRHSAQVLPEHKSERIWKLSKLLPDRHGERGDVFSELFLFSVVAWKRLFKRNRWTILYIKKNRLFYTGELLFGRGLSLKFRRILSYVLGSTCNIFYLRKSAGKS
jgi:SAM-dependent methyltransferase